jgi:serine O-acetyltransferase
LRRDAARLVGGSGRSPARAVVEALLFDNGFQAVVAYRLARWFKARGIPFFGPFFSRLGLLATGAEISPGAAIGPGLKVAHGVGLVVGGYARVGADALLLHGVTLGSPDPERSTEMPRIGDRAFLGAGASLIGAVTVGDDVTVGVGAIVVGALTIGAGATIGPGALVTADVPPGGRVRRVATPAGAPPEAVSAEAVAGP